MKIYNDGLTAYLRHVNVYGIRMKRLDQLYEFASNLPLKDVNKAYKEIFSFANNRQEILCMVSIYSFNQGYNEGTVYAIESVSGKSSN